MNSFEFEISTDELQYLKFESTSLSIKQRCNESVLRKMMLEFSIINFYPQRSY